MNVRDSHGARAMFEKLRAGEVVVCDGAMGTMLHAAGVPLDRVLPELNLSRPALVRDLHAAYVAAGARILQTNTFGANRLRLAGEGLEDSVSEINIAAARLAREAAGSGEQVLVAGSVGPAASAPAVRRVPRGARTDILREQIVALCDWVDLLILETFGDLESLVQAVEVATAETDLPVVAQLTFGDDGRTLRGDDPADAAAVLSELGISALGANCTVGPAVLVDVVRELAGATDLPVSVQPNAGVPHRLGGQVRYARNAAYFAEATPRFVGCGATLLGGCCGTTPAHVRAISRVASTLPPARRAAGRRAGVPGAAQDCAALQISGVAARPAGVPTDDSAASTGWPWESELVVAIGLQAPQGPQVPHFVERAGKLHTAGAGVLAITEPAPPATRVNPVGVAVVLRERVGCEVLLPVETADRNLAALQADLLGAHALGLRMVVCRTGNPRVAGDYPSAGSAWDVDSVGLIAMLDALNEGVDWRGVATAERTRFVIGALFRTTAADIGRELERAEAKVQAGAHFLITDVIYDIEEAAGVLGMLRARGIALPVLAALAPFADVRTLQRLSHEVPEITIPMSALATARRNRENPQHTVEVSVAAVEKLRHLVSGVVVHVPDDMDEQTGRLVGALAQLRTGS
ncbi:MAG TPA: bifunctional homocysteine S-methyltransferase/methylenetetrahydrofolate reductase [Pseudonocardiaceae bacterium]|nr:bifunctional homocysteine S-methyltransferase/methylenetetrahydrofolate reductase [Pseudonocardiaceae bacterium]